MSSGLTVAFLALTSIGFANTTDFQVQVFDVNPNFFATGVNHSGTMIGYLNDSQGNRLATWSPTGVKAVTTASGDVFQPSVSDSGTVYGANNGRIVSWNARGGRKELVSQAGVKFSLIDSGDDDTLLLKGTYSNAVRYFRFKAGSGLKEFRVQSSRFTPSQIAYDGTVYGTVPDNNGGSLFARLSLNGSYQVDYRAVSTFSASANSPVSKSQSFDFYANGVTVVTTTTRVSVPGQSSESRTQDIYAANGSHYTLAYDSYSSHVSSVSQGNTAKMFLADGSTVGVDANGSKFLFSLLNPTGVSLDNSLHNDSLLFGNDEVLVGMSVVSGHMYYSMTRVR